MKRCIVCGSIGDDDSTVCKVCGNPFIDLADQSDKGVSMDEMERQLEQVWSKVQESGQPAGQIGDGMPVIQDRMPEEPEVTVLPDLPDEKPAVTEGASVEADASEKRVTPDLAQASGAAREEAGQTQPKAEKVPSAEESAEQPVQQEPQGQIREKAESRPAAEENGKAVGQEAQGLTGMGVKSSEPAGDSASPMQNAPQEQKRPGTENIPSAQGTRSVEEAMESARRQPQDQKQAASVRADQAASERQTSRPRRRSGPQIYGQDSMTEYRGAQGVIRRDVHAGSAAASGNMGYQSEKRTQQMRTVDRQSAVSGTSERGRQGAGPSREVQTDRTMNGENSAQGGAAYRQEARPADRRTAPPAVAPSQRLNARQRGDMQPYAQVPQEDRQQEKGAFAARKTLEISRGRLTSPLLLFVALFHSIYFVGAVAAVFMRELDYSLFGRLLGSLSLPTQLASYVSMFQAAMAQLDNGAIAIDLVLRVPDLLFFLGIWLLCLTARTSKEQMSGAGFVFVRIAIVLNMIAACLLLFVVLVLSVTLVIASWSAGSGRLPIAAAVLAVAVIAAMVIVMYYFCYLATISAVSKNARFGEAYGKASAYVALVHIVLAFTAIVNVLSGILNGWIPVAVGGVGKFLWMLLFGVWIFNYRNAMSEYNE